MNSDILMFFNTRAAALPLYEAVEKRICANVDGVKIKVGKSQISFYNKHMFACVSFLTVKKKKELPPGVHNPDPGPGQAAGNPGAGSGCRAVPRPPDKPYCNIRHQPGGQTADKADKTGRRFCRGKVKRPPERTAEAWQVKGVGGFCFWGAAVHMRPISVRCIIAGER